jgi:cyclophilin family peptidyl-prolyl cis-trans isomerase
MSLRNSPWRAMAASLLLLLSSLAVAAEPEAIPAANPKVRISTTSGSFVIELDRERAPLTVANFLERVRAGHYSGTIFHRVVAGFLAQGGVYDPALKAKDSGAKIANESGNGLSNLRGTVGMARDPSPHSADVQFFINLRDNAMLDPQPSRWGYAVFGRVIEGMTVVDEIGNVATGEGGPFTEHVPLKPIVIESAEVLP